MVAALTQQPNKILNLGGPIQKLLEFLNGRIEDPEDPSVDQLSAVIEYLRDSLTTRPFVETLPGFAFSSEPQNIQDGMRALANAVVITLKHHEEHRTTDSSGNPITSLRQIIDVDGDQRTVRLISGQEANQLKWRSVPITVLDEHPDVIKLSLKMKDTHTAHLVCHVGDVIHGSLGNVWPAGPFRNYPAARFPYDVCTVAGWNVTNESDENRANMRSSFAADMLAFLAAEHELSFKDAVEFGDPGKALGRVIQIVNSGSNFQIDETTENNVKVAAIFLMLKGRILSEGALAIFLDYYWSGNWATYDADSLRAKYSCLLKPANLVPGEGAGNEILTPVDDAEEIALRLTIQNLDSYSKAAWKQAATTGQFPSNEALKNFIRNLGTELLSSAMRDWNARQFTPTIASIPLGELIQAAITVTGMPTAQIATYVMQKSPQVFKGVTPAKLGRQLRALLRTSLPSGLNKDQLTCIVKLLSCDVDNSTRESLNAKIEATYQNRKNTESASLSHQDSDELFMPSV